MTDAAVPDPSGGLNAEIAKIPKPSTSELRRRSSLLRQSLRFVALNLKILKLSRQHH